jgi:hypothetical protein
VIVNQVVLVYQIDRRAIRLAQEPRKPSELNSLASALLFDRLEVVARLLEEVHVALPAAVTPRARANGLIPGNKDIRPQGEECLRRGRGAESYRNPVGAYRPLSFGEVPEDWRSLPEVLSMFSTSPVVFSQASTTGTTEGGARSDSSSGLRNFRAGNSSR